VLSVNDMDEHESWQRWDTYNRVLTWQAVLARAAEEHARRVARQALAEFPDVTAVEALAANARLVTLLVSRRWYVIQAGREAGASWDDIGAALGMTGHEAQDWYREQISRREQDVPDVHDAARARAVLDSD
jgi:hypothetical protein